MCTLIGAWVFLMENMVYGLPLHVNRSLVNIYGHNQKMMFMFLPLLQTQLLPDVIYSDI